MVKFQTITTLLASLFFSSFVLAAPITPDAARRNAMAFARNSNLRSLSPTQAGKIVYSDKSNLLHLVKVSPSRIVIASGDDVAAPILGYFDAGISDCQEMPDGLKYMLALYADEIASAASSGHVAASAAAFEPVVPLLGDIAWDQTEPYNLLCPTYFGNKRSAVGCAATALSQVMGYYRWPQQGRGEVTYTLTTIPGKELHTDFSKSFYDWDNITPVYGLASTEAERNAVALLCYDAGVALRMEYGEMSGALPEYWPLALRDNFGYDGDLQMHYRQYHGIDSWDGIIRAELAAGRPVLFTGYSAAGSRIDIFTVAGAHVAAKASASSSERFELQAGVYLVRVDSKCVKVIVK